MSEKTKVKRYDWVDYTKAFACILVALGHLFMSFEASGWINANAVYYCLPIQLIYTFHVPLFFVCSGFLYQLNGKTQSPQDHIKTIKTKALYLGVPYFVFSVITILSKVIFSNDVNNQAPPLIKTLFAEPIAPYWYLYVLFLLFCLTPRFNSKKMLRAALAISLVLKIAYITALYKYNMPDAVAKVLDNSVWFLIGMNISAIQLKRNVLSKITAAASAAIGIGLSFVYYRESQSSLLIRFIIGLAMVYAVLQFFINLNINANNKIFSKIKSYFMPVYVMHTIFAAMIRIALIKIGVDSLLVHTIAGVLFTFLAPIAVYEVAQRKWYLLFWIEPKAALKRRKQLYE